MEICKEAAVKGIGTPDREELALINALARRELGEDEVYTFALRLCDNDIDRDGERFDDGTLDALAPMFVGVSGVFDHQWSARGQTARIYRAGVVEGEGVLTADGRPYRYLKGWAYLMRTAENAALIAEIDGGIKSAGVRLEDEARLGRKYLKGLRSELVRLAGIAEPELGHGLLEKVAGKLDEEELAGLIKLYRGKADRLLAGGPQLSYGPERTAEEGSDGAFLI